MIGYKKDAHGNFHRVDVPGADKRAQGLPGPGATGITTQGLPAWGGAALTSNVLDFTQPAQIQLAAGSRIRVLQGPVDVNGRPTSQPGGYYKVSASSPRMADAGVSALASVLSLGLSNIATAGQHGWLPPATWWIGSPGGVGTTNSGIKWDAGTTSTSTRQTQTTGQTITVTQRTNVYDSPSTSARIVGTIGPGRVPILQRQPGWIQTTPPGWRRNGWIQVGAGAQSVYGTPARQAMPTPSGIAPPLGYYTPSGMAPPAGYPVGYPSGYGYRPARYAPLPVAVPATGAGGIDPNMLQILLQQAQAQGAEQATLQALLQQLQSGAGLAPAVQSTGLDLSSLLQGAGVTLDAAGLPVPAGYVGTDTSGGDVYADSGYDATGGALGDYHDPRDDY